MPDTRTYYMVKHALTEGIQAIEGAPFEPDPSFVAVEGDFRLFKLGRAVFADRADAVVAAQAMRDAEIAALQKRLVELQGMTFDNEQA